MSLKQFLQKDYNKTKEFGFTHTNMSGGMIPPGSYFISKENKDKFYDLYYQHVFVDKNPAHITEAPDFRGISPFKIDIDLKYIHNKVERLYDYKLIKELIKYHYEEIENWVLEPTDEERLCFVFEKTKPIRVINKNKDCKDLIVKDGIHMMMPHLVTKWALQEKVRDYVLQKCDENKTFKNYNLTIKLKDVIDWAIIHRNNWLMYGGSKSKKEPYLLTKIFKYEDGKVKEIKIDREKYSDKNLIKLLSIRDRADNLSFIKLEKSKELEEETDKIIIKKKNLTAPKCKDIESGNKELDKHALEYVFKLIDLLDISRAEEYSKWSELIWCCHNIHNVDDKLLKKVIEFSQKPEKYKDTADVQCRMLWEKSKFEGGLSLGSLKHWAKLDNPLKYDELNERNVWSKINKLLYKQTLSLNTCDVSEILHNLYRDEYICVSVVKKMWYQFKNHKWFELDSPSELRSLLKTKVYGLYKKAIHDYQNKEDADLNKAQKFYKLADKLRDTGYINSVMKEADNDFFDSTQEFYNELNENPKLICFNNGVYDLSKDKDNFRPGRPEDRISFSTKIDYVPLDKNNFHQQMIIEEIENFIEKILPDEDVREYTLTLLASFLNGSTKNEQFHFWTGTGGNGKSKLVELFEMAFGDYCCKLPISLLTQKRKASGSAEPEMARTKGKRFACLQEPSKGARINEGLLKEYTGGDKISTRALYKDTFEFKPQFKMVLCCNAMPELDAKDGGLWRRVRVIEFKSKFKDNPNPLTEQLPYDHPDNPREFQKEPVDERFPLWKEVFMSLLLNKYYKKYKYEGLVEPEEVLEYTRKVQEENDDIKKFWDEMVIIGDSNKDKLKINEVYNAFKDWLKERYGKNKRTINRDKFKLEIDNMIKSVKTSKDIYNNPERCKRNNNKTLLGWKANGWWGWKWKDGCDTEEEDDELDYDAIINNIENQENNNNGVNFKLIEDDSEDSNNEEEEPEDIIGFQIEKKTKAKTNNKITDYVVVDENSNKKKKK